MGTHMRVLDEDYPMNTNVRRFRWFSKTLLPCSLDESSLSIGWVKVRNAVFVKFGIVFIVCIEAK